MHHDREYADDDLVSTAVAARILGVHRNTIRTHAGRELPVRRTPGGHRRFRVGDLRKLALPEQRDVTPPSDEQDDGDAEGDLVGTRARGAA